MNAPPPLSGLFLVDKPEGPTSRTVLDDVQAATGQTQLGHTGTLDPLASGLLLIVGGKARKLQDTFLHLPKVYETTIRFGVTSKTYDREGAILDSPLPARALEREEILAILERFTGEIEQLPPAYSALKVQGRRAHELARAGCEPELSPRRVRIDAIELLDFTERCWNLRVTCSAGTYIRSLARDLGTAAGTQAIVESLRRTRSGPFSVEEAKAPLNLRSEDLLPIPSILSHFSRLDVDAQKARRLADGVWMPGLDPKGVEPIFAWFQDAPLCRLKRVDAHRWRSDLLLDRPGS